MKHIFFSVLIASVFFSSCRFVEGQKIKGDGNVAKDQRSVSGFTGVETNGLVDIIVMPGDFKVVVESDQNIIPYIVTEVINNRLVVHFKEDFYSFNYTSAKVYVTAPTLNVFETHGSGNITSDGKFSSGERTEITVGGSGDIKLELSAPAIESTISGSGNITLAGTTKDFSSEINGSGDMNAFDLKAEDVKTSVHGSGNTQVSASVKLDAEIYGSGDVDYRGAPQVSSSIHGSGAVKPSN
ncbi:MAG: head GIN domain-containing protein [Bacteroidota bacterium]